MKLYAIQTHFLTDPRNAKQDRQCTYKRNIDARSRNHCCRGKPVSINYYECLSAALVIQHAMLMRRTILSSVACLALPYFFTLSQLLSKTFLMLTRSQREWPIIINVHRSSGKVPVILVMYE